MFFPKPHIIYELLVKKANFSTNFFGKNRGIFLDFCSSLVRVLFDSALQKTMFCRTNLDQYWDKAQMKLQKK